MHKNGIFSGVLHHFPIHLVRSQFPDSLLPYLFRLSHGHPYIRINHIGILGSCRHIFSQGNRSSRTFRHCLTFLHKRFLRKILCRSTGGKMHAQLCADHHQGISHIIAGIPHIGQLHALDAPQLFLNGQKICKHLGRMKFVCKTIPHRHACILCKFFHDFLSIAAVFDSFIHPAKHTCRVRNTLLIPNLRPLRIQISGSHAQIMGSHLKGTSGPSAGFFKNQRYILTFMHICGKDSFFLFIL